MKLARSSGLALIGLAACGGSAGADADTGALATSITEGEAGSEDSAEDGGESSATTGTTASTTTSAGDGDGDSSGTSATTSPTTSTTSTTGDGDSGSTTSPTTTSGTSATTSTTGDGDGDSGSTTSATSTSATTTSTTGDGDGDGDFGNCGWDTTDGWYECGGMGSDPGGTPIGCPSGVVAGQACNGLVDTIGCCETDGTNYYCSTGGVIVGEFCGDGDGSSTGASGDGDGDGTSTTSATTSATTSTTSATTGVSTSITGDGDGDGDGDGAAGDFAEDIALARVEVTQGTAIQIGNGNSPIAAGSRNARLIRERQALFRAGWTLQSGFTNRSIEGRLVITRPDMTTRTFTHTLSVAGNSNFSSYNGTFRWLVPANEMAPGTRYSIALHESGGATGNPATPPRIPSSGTADLGIPADTMQLRVVLVPVRWNYGGNDRTPNLSQSDLDIVYDTLHSQNPVTDIELTVRSTPVLWQSAISLSGILNAISSARASDNPDSNVYYEGIADFGCAYVSGSSCSQWGGTTGVGFIAGTSSWSDDQRASVSVWYNPQSSANTITHELGHNQGRNHAPCGTSGDASYPYSNAIIGVQGWDNGTTSFFSSTDTHDYMAYCSPSWVSDWTWETIGDRVQLLSTWSDAPPNEGSMLQGVIDPEGRESWIVINGVLPELDELDPDLEVTFFDETDEIARTNAIEAPLSDDAGRMVLIPLPDSVDGERLSRVASIERVTAQGQIRLVDADFDALSGTLSLGQ